MKELLSTREFERALATGAAVVVVDSPTGRATLHPGTRRCPFLKLDYFERKVIGNDRAEGGYWAVATTGEAASRWGDALRECRKCGVHERERSTAQPRRSRPPRRMVPVARTAGPPLGATPSLPQRFGATDAWWRATVAATPRFGSFADYFAEAVPTIGACEPNFGPLPCVVVASVVDPAPKGRSEPSGPKDRAKGLLDALHDGRKLAPLYEEMGALAPLPDDTPRAVRGLAVEVTAGDPARVHYSIGNDLAVAGEPLCEVEVERATTEAPNDVRESGAALEAARLHFTQAVVAGWRRARVGRAHPSRARTLVVRHRPFRVARDEDNTWATWLACLRGTSEAARAGWTTPSPFLGCKFSAMASICDSAIECEVRYELYS